MTDQLDEVWHSRDLPVLREVCRTKERQQRGFVDLEPISETLGLSSEQVTAAALNLERDGLVELLDGFGGGVPHVKDVSGRALEKVGLWPSPETALDRMIAALEAIAANTDDEDTRPCTQSPRRLRRRRPPTRRHGRRGRSRQPATPLNPEPAA